MANKLVLARNIILAYNTRIHISNSHVSHALGVILLNIRLCVLPDRATLATVHVFPGSLEPWVIKLFRA